MIVGPCSKGPFKSVDLSSGFIDGSNASDEPNVCSVGGCPENSPQETAKMERARMNQHREEIIIKYAIYFKLGDGT